MLEPKRPAQPGIEKRGCAATMESIAGRAGKACGIGTLGMNYGKGYLEKGGVSIWIFRILSGFLSLERIASQLLYVYAVV